MSKFQAKSKRTLAHSKNKNKKGHVKPKTKKLPNSVVESKVNHDDDDIGNKKMPVETDNSSGDSKANKKDFGMKTDVKKPKSKKRRGIKEKRTVTGISNWALLCSELKKNPCARKKARKSEEPDEGPPAKIAKPEIWFDDVDESLLESNDDATRKKSAKTDVSPTPASVKTLVKTKSFQGKTKCIGMDCEMVGVGRDGEESILARVSLVNIYGHCLYDKFVKPSERVVDYRTAVSGVTKELIDEKGEPFTKVQKEVSDLINGAVLVGHALQNDLRVLYLSHPHRDIRDTSSYKPFREQCDGKMPSLRKLSEKLLGVAVQKGEHSSVEDAQAAMRLYTMHKKKWEKTLKDAYRLRKKYSAKSKKKGSIVTMDESE